MLISIRARACNSFPARVVPYARGALGGGAALDEVGEDLSLLKQILETVGLGLALLETCNLAF
jgi:hypothetical protein